MNARPGHDVAYHHLGGETPLLGLTIDGRFRQMVERFGERDAVVSVHQGVRLTYAALDREVERVARGLVAIGCGRGERVGIWSTNNIEWVLVQLATARIGAVLVNINPAYRAAELAGALELAELRVLVMIPRFRSSDYVGMVRELCPEVDEQPADGFAPGRFPALSDLILYDPEDAAATIAPAPAFLDWRSFLAGGKNVDATTVDDLAAEVDPDDPVNIQFTSGTTGSPKAVVLTHHNLVNNAYFQGEIMQLSEHDRLCVPVPFYHCFGMVVSNLLCLLRGAAIVVPTPHFDSGPTLAAVEAERCTVLHGVPTMFLAELDHPDRPNRDLSSLRTGIMAGAPCPPELLRRVIEELGCREILVGYGQTEASPITHCTRADDSFERRTETVGTNLPHQEVKVVDPETGTLLQVDEIGEVCFRGYHVMREYAGDPEATRAAIDSAGWLHSGDLGILDADGYLRITGRLKNMIIRGGENIYPAEIEAFYFEHPDVAEVSVFGVPDDALGEEVGAWIKLHDGAATTPEQLREHARGRIAHFKVPRYVWIVDEFPLTVTGKIQKFRIREIVEGWLREGRLVEHELAAE